MKHILFSRRKFVEYQAAVVAASMFPDVHGLHHEPFTRVRRQERQGRYNALQPLIDPSLVHPLALRALDVARASGAAYADVRLTRTVSSSSSHDPDRSLVEEDREYLAVGIRVLVQGQWGFAASPYWTVDEVVRLAQASVSQAKSNGIGGPSTRELAHASVATGTWNMPGIDPFTVSIEERNDFMMAWMHAITETHGDHVIGRVGTNGRMRLKRQERYFASTDAAWTVQTVYETSGVFPVIVTPTGWSKQQRAVTVQAKGLFPQGKGWEMFLEHNPREQLPALLTHGAELLSLRTRAGQLGRFDAVLDATTTARLVDATFGIATQLDRALGYEANASGTSYLGPRPLTLLGALRAASPLVTVMGNRSLPGGGATVKWDDEGVEPDEFPVIQDGMLVDYQTTREHAMWLAPWYAKRHRPVRSHGCAGTPSALAVTMQHTPNLSLTPGSGTTTFDDLVKDTREGIAVIEGDVYTDFQAKTGVIDGTIREIKNGALGDVLQVRILFDTTKLWKKLTALGGASSTGRVAAIQRKGQPQQAMLHTVDAVPAKFLQVNVIRGDA